MTNAASTTETSVNLYQTTRRSKPKDSPLHTWHHENLMSHHSSCSYKTTNKWLFNSCIISVLVQICSYCQQFNRLTANAKRQCPPPTAGRHAASGVAICVIMQLVLKTRKNSARTVSFVYSSLTPTLLLLYPFPTIISSPTLTRTPFPSVFFQHFLIHVRTSKSCLMITVLSIKHFAI
jgi:hypothetical protein